MRKLWILVLLVSILSGFVIPEVTRASAAAVVKPQMTYNLERYIHLQEGKPNFTGPGGGGDGVRRESKRLEAYQWALKQKGCWYVWGGTGPCSSGYDCSGLVYSAYGSEGMNFGRTVADMVDSGRLIQIPKDEAKKGNLVVFNGTQHVEFFVKGDWTYGAADQGTQVGFHDQNFPWWNSIAYYRVKGAAKLVPVK